MKKIESEREYIDKALKMSDEKRNFYNLLESLAENKEKSKLLREDMKRVAIETIKELNQKE